MIKILITDIDGVITDGKSYILRGDEVKTISYQDLDAINDIRNEGIKFAIVTGENNEFTMYVKERIKPDFFLKGCKSKGEAIDDISRIADIDENDMCYIGDGKYDIAAIEKVGFSMCPINAIDKVKEEADIVLKHRGGDGCIAEAYEILKRKEQIDKDKVTIKKRIIEHKELINKIIFDSDCISQLNKISNVIIESYKKGGKLLLCGNGGSAADAQHLAAELVSRFYKERKALSAEALNANTSIITAIGNDYDYANIFARSVEAQANVGDVLIGITTSGKSTNIIEAFRMARNLKVITILFTGSLDEKEEILKYVDYNLKVPSKDTPRIQEMHILLGHIMCEIIENKMFECEESKNE